MESSDLQSTPSLVTPRQRWWLCAIAGFLAAAHLVCVNNKWYPSPDSALYATLGRSLAEGNGYVFNGQVDNTVTPGLPMVIAAARLITGGEGWWLCNLFITASGFVALWCVWAVLRRLLPPDPSDPPTPEPERMRDALLSPAPAKLTAGLTTLMLAGSHLFFLHAHYVLTDMPFIALAWAALYAALRASRGHGAWLALVAVLSAVAMTIRAPLAPFLALLAGGLVLQPLPGPEPGFTPAPAWRRWLAAGVLLAATAATAAFWYHWGRSLGTLPYVESASQHAAEFSTRILGVAWVLGGIMSTLLVSNDDLPWLGLIGGAVALLGLAVLWRRGLRMGLLVLVPYTLFIVVARRAQIPERYLLPVAPLLYLGLVQGAWSLAMAAGHYARSRRTRLAQPTAPQAEQTAAPVTRTPLAVLFILLAIVLIPNVARIGGLGYRMAYLARTDLYDEKARSGIGYAKEHKQIAAVVSREVPEGGRFLSERGIGRIAHYYCRRPFVILPLKIDEPLDAGTALRLWEFWQGHPDIPVIVMPWSDNPKKQPEYAARIGELFATQRELHRGKTWIIFKRQP